MATNSTTSKPEPKVTAQKATTTKAPAKKAVAKKAAAPVAAVVPAKGFMSWSNIDLRTVEGKTMRSDKHNGETFVVDHFTSGKKWVILFDKAGVRHGRTPIAAVQAHMAGVDAGVAPADNKDLIKAHSAHATDYADILGKGAEVDYKTDLGIVKPGAVAEAAAPAKPAAKAAAKKAAAPAKAEDTDLGI